MIILLFHKLSIFGDDRTLYTGIHDDIHYGIDGVNNDDIIGNSVDEFYEEINKYSFFFPKSIPIYNVRKYNHSGMI